MKTWRSALARDGFVVIRGAGDLGAFERVLSELGDVLVRTSVELRSNVSTYLCQADAVPFHTDHPDVDVVAWWCERQDDSDGASVLIDTRDVLAAVNEETRRALAEVCLPRPDLDVVANGSAPQLRPVLSSSGGVYFASWLKPVTTTMDAWVEFVRAVASSPQRDVLLMPNDALLIDNHRMLHGRRALVSGSKRRLHRAWVACASFR